MSASFQNVIGLMSGTSVDGIDVAWVQISRPRGCPKVQLKAFKTFPLDKKLRNDILGASGHASLSVEDLCDLNFRVGEAFASAVISLSKTCKFSLERIDLIGSHGQTIRHLPASGSTLQIGEPAIIAERTGITTVADFRPADMAAGGQGAPLASYLHYVLFHQLGVGVGIQNIGGIGNLTYLKPRAALKDVLAFDTGPGNVLMDSAMFMLTQGKQSFDREGRLAARGTVREKLLKEWLRHPFFKKRGPKSTGRELFGCSFAQRILRKCRRMKKEDIIATLTAFTAHAIARHCKNDRFKMKELIIGGGGAKNKTLYMMIQRLLPDIQLKRFEDYHINGDAVEAMAFALLAYETLNGRAGNIPKTTGASHFKVLGKISPGNNFKRFSLK